MTRSILFFFSKFAIELWPLTDVRIWFLLNILRMNKHNLTKFCIHIIIDKIYVGIVKQSVIFCKFATELWSLIDVRIWFLLNILRINQQNLTKLCLYIVINKISVGIVKLYICKFATELPLDWRQNLVLAQNIENEWAETKFCILIITDKIYFRIVMRHQFFKYITYLCPVIALWRGYSQIL